MYIVNLTVGLLQSEKHYEFKNCLLISLLRILHKTKKKLIQIYYFLHGNPPNEQLLSFLIFEIHRNSKKLYITDNNGRYFLYMDMQILSRKC